MTDITEKVARAIMTALNGAEIVGPLTPNEARHGNRLADAALSASGYRERETENKRLRQALVELRLTARILLQNSIGCATNHYGQDHELFGLPGWLADSEAAIKRAEAMIESSTALSKESA